MKAFNTVGVCIPEKHYMVDLTERVAQIRAMVDDGKYFCINRARQYGKTTTLNALRKDLSDRNTVISLDFQGIGAAGFRTEEDFSQAFCGLLLRATRVGLILPETILDRIEVISKQDPPTTKLGNLFEILTDWCASSERPIVLIIDEVDSATNNQVFLDFLAQLRQGYLDRESMGIPAFQSVILAGVTDVKHLKSKLRDEDQHKVNSPWNIAKDFNVDMSFSTADIAGMLDQYENEHHAGLPIGKIAQEIRDYTSGYPFLVSRICELIVENGLPWSHAGIADAVKRILEENNTLFESLMGKLKNMPKLKSMLYEMLMHGTVISYNPDQEDIRQLEMYGFIRNSEQRVVIANRIFEMRLYNLFLIEEELKSNRFSAEGDRFREKDGRELFLLYLKPIINGSGNYYIEAQTRDQSRTDLIVDYRGEQFIIEMKIWRGDAYNARGEQQLSDYLDYFHLDKGYMLSFNFNKNKQTGLHTVRIGDREIVEAVV